MIKVAAVTSGVNTPSTRFRIRQHIKNLKEDGVSVKEYVPRIDKNYSPARFFGVSPKKYPLRYAAIQASKLATRIPSVIGSYCSDVTLLSREILPGYPSIEFIYKRPIITDIDDAIWLSRPFGKVAARNVACRSDVLIVGNQFLASWFHKFNDNIYIVPTAVEVPSLDLESIPLESAGRDEVITIGWIGTKGNLRYLKAIEPALNEVLDVYSKKVRLLVMSDGIFSSTRKNVINISWSLDKQNKFFEAIDIGIMPLFNDEWCRGKCSFKLLQYMAYGKSSVASPVGMNIEVINNSEGGVLAATHREWVDGLRLLIESRSTRLAHGKKGRDHVKTYYARKVVSEKISSILHGVV